MDVGGSFAPALNLGGDFPHFKAVEGPSGISAVLVSFPMLGRGMLTGTICIPGGGRGREGGGTDGGGADGGGRRLRVLPPSSVQIFWTVWQSAILALALALALCLQPLLLRDLPLPLRNVRHLSGELTSAPAGPAPAGPAPALAPVGPARTLSHCLAAGNARPPPSPSPCASSCETCPFP